jgi:hypothetical protein
MEGQDGATFVSLRTGGMMLCALALAFFVNNALDRRRRNPRNLPPPPGPPKVPFFGNKFQMAAPGPLWVTYTKWAREYGQ